MRVKTLNKHPFILLATLYGKQLFFSSKFSPVGNPKNRGVDVTYTTWIFLGKMGQSHHSTSRIFFCFEITRLRLERFVACCQKIF